MTLTKTDMKICKRRNELKRRLIRQRAWLKNPPLHLGITEADIAFERKLYEIWYRELEKLEWQ